MGRAEPIAASPPPLVPAVGMLRRLTRSQFRNAVRDVFGVEVDTIPQIMGSSVTEIGLDAGRVTAALAGIPA